MTGPVPITYDPREVLRSIIEANFDTGVWSRPIVNRAWYETKRPKSPQITLMPITAVPELSELDKTTSPVDYDDSFFLSVHCVNRAQRWNFIKEIRKIFNDPALTRNPQMDGNPTGIYEITVEDESGNDRDKKEGNTTWRCDWTIHVHYGEEYA